MDFPGPGRGYISWQRDGVGAGQESVTLIGHDEAGMAEAVGSFFEAIAGIEPLTKWTLPTSDRITPAAKGVGVHPTAKVAWKSPVGDRVLAFKAAGAELLVLAHDGSRSTISAGGKQAKSQLLTAAEFEATKKEFVQPPDAAAREAASKQARPDRMFKLAAASADKAAIAYWGGTLRIVDKAGKILTEQQLPQDVTALTWFEGRCIAGLADGRVLGLEVK